MSRQPTEGFASRKEAVEAIRALSPADQAKLMAVAKYFWKRRLFATRDCSEPEDLLQEAVLRTLRGRRRWRRSVPIVKHLDRTMESLSSHLVVKGENVQVIGKSVEEVDPSGRQSTGGCLFTSVVEVQAAANDELQRIEALFSDDVEAFEVLRCRSERCSAAETRMRLGMTKTQYDSVLKRIRRKFIRYSLDTEDEQ